MNTLSILLLAIAVCQAIGFAIYYKNSRRTLKDLAINLAEKSDQILKLIATNNKLINEKPQSIDEVFEEGSSQSFDSSIKRFANFSPKAKATFLYRFIASMERELVLKAIQYSESKLSSLQRKAS